MRHHFPSQPHHQLTPIEKIRLPLKSRDALPPLLSGPGEKITEGLDGLRERLLEYFQMGARFAKWRAVIAIGYGIPTRSCIEANAHALARMPRCVRRPDWCRLSNQKCSWTAIIPWSAAAL